jgi:hypothetical protein
MPEQLEQGPVPEVDPLEEIGSAPVGPQDGKDPYPPDVAVDQDRPD